MTLDLAETAFGGRVRVTDECMTAVAEEEERRKSGGTRVPDGYSQNLDCMCLALLA